MRFLIEGNDPVYLQIYRQLREVITSGGYRFGEKLPSKRLIAQEAQVSVVTVEHALAILCDEGYVESKERSGYFVIFRAGDGFTATKEQHLPPPLAAELSGASQLPFSVFAGTMRRVLSVYGERILIKSPNTGCDELKIVLCDYLSRSRGMQVRPEQIVIGAGAEYLYGLIIQLLGTKRRYGIEKPCYEKIKCIYTANGVRFEELRMGKDGILTEDLEKSRAQILHITPYRSFPTGITASASKREEYLRFASRKGGYIIEDDFDSELTVSRKLEDTLFSRSNGENVIYLNTFSATIAPAMRVGYMILPEGLLADFAARLGAYSCTVPTFEQYVLAEFIASGNFERHVNRVRRARRNAQKG